MTHNYDEAVALRPLLFSLAYRMLGSVVDAEDVVQQAYLRFLGYLDRPGAAEVSSVKAMLTTITTRLAIDHLRLARVKRETYLGPWLPEPLLTAPDAADLASTADSLSMAFLVLLEALSPVERAVFLLREVFAYDYGDIAAVVGKTEENCRQILTRARRHVGEGRRRFDADVRHHAELVERFFAAARDGEFDDLVALLAEDVAFYGDGGGVGRGLPRPVCGQARVARVLAAIVGAYRRIDARFVQRSVNGGTGVLVLDAQGRLISVLTADAIDNRISTVRSVINPDKLVHLGYPLSPLARRDGPVPPELAADR